MAPAPARPDDGLLWEIGKTVVALLVGGAVAFTGLKWWRRAVDRRLDDHEERFTQLKNDRTVEMLRMKGEFTARIDELEHQVATWQRTSDRRQLFILEVLSDVANKIGANQRINDLAIRLLHRETDEQHESD